MDPLGYWRAADAEDRQGIAENLHVQGYLAYWDALRERHPDMLIDTCASGGRRMDLESLRRSVPLWRSDHAYEVIGNQCLTYGLSQWVPYWGTATRVRRHTTAPEPPRGRVDFGHRGPRHGGGRRRAGRVRLLAFNALCQQREATSTAYGDFYPLSPPSVESSRGWRGSSISRADRHGMAFRRGDSPYLQPHALRGLDPDASYRLTLLGQKGDWVQTGEELLGRESE